jgi:hypothetical protein
LEVAGYAMCTVHIRSTVYAFNPKRREFKPKDIGGKVMKTETRKRKKN